jgi:hypothetical protein
MAAPRMPPKHRKMAKRDRWYHKVRETPNNELTSCLPLPLHLSGGVGDGRLSGPAIRKPDRRLFVAYRPVLRSHQLTLKCTDAHAVSMADSAIRWKDVRFHVLLFAVCYFCLED